MEVTEYQDLPERGAVPLQFRAKADGGLSGDCFIEIYDPRLVDLAAKLGSGETGEKAIKALLQVLSAAAGKLTATLRAQYGELTFKIDSVAGLASGGMYVVPLRLHAERPSTPSIFLYFDGALLQALGSAPARKDAPNQAGRQFDAANLRMVMDVELNVSLRFGQVQLPLREVLELNSGSVIELDRMVDDPVEMLLDGKVVARGEAVIVDGNYGLRVTEITQGMEHRLLG
jgi:flagellar motor switch protein FliN/FliY